VGIVSTGVHDSVVARLPGDIGLFLDRERVHVRAQQHSLSGLATLEEAREAGLSQARPYCETKVGEPFGHDAGRPHLLESKLWVLVQVRRISSMLDESALTSVEMFVMGFLLASGVKSYRV
jgi:hypothetical protein